MSRPAWVFNPDPDWTAYWESAQPHREIVTQMAIDSAATGATLCVWGAGTCHDLDLNRLADHYGEVTLIDLNWQHVQWGMEYQDCVRRPNVNLQAPVDVAGTHADLPSPEGMTGEQIAQRWFSALTEHRIADVGCFDVVVSAGMLSQIIMAGKDALGDAHDRPVELFEISRRTHFARMLEHLSSDGCGLLVTDFMQSDRVPELRSPPVLEDAIMAELAKGYFYGLEPDHLCRDLLQSKSLAGRVSGVDRSNYWLWKMKTTLYACYALRFRKAGNAPL